eukprot:scaffold92383_cov33-Tisochrysis_lutea.AAC.1
MSPFSLPLFSPCSLGPSPHRAPCPRALRCLQPPRPSPPPLSPSSGRYMDEDIDEWDPSKGSFAQVLAPTPPAAPLSSLTAACMPSLLSVACGRWLCGWSCRALGHVSS